MTALLAPLAPPDPGAPPAPLPPPAAVRQPAAQQTVAAPARRSVRWLRRVLALALFGGALALDLAAVFLIPVLFVLIVPFEKLFPRHRQRLRRPGLGTDIAFGIAQPVMATAGGFVGGIIGILSLAWLPGLALRPLVLAMPPGLRVLAGVVLFDFVTYWLHRWSHEVGFLWRFHSVHHSTEKLDWVSGLRGHPFDGALLAPPFVFLLAAGFSFEVAGALAIVQLVTGLFLHANVRWRWRALQRIVITPEFHHWHHADEPVAHHTNYSVFLPIWDIMFGTYFVPKDRRPSVYGVTPPLPEGLVPLLRHPFTGLRSPRQILRHPLVSLREGWRSLRRGMRQIVATSRRRRPSPGGTASQP